MCGGRRLGMQGWEAVVAMSVVLVFVGVLLRTARACSWLLALLLWTAGLGCRPTGSEDLCYGEWLLVWSFMGMPACLVFCAIVRQLRLRKPAPWLVRRAFQRCGRQRKLVARRTLIRL